jgi:hypothetical protein
MILQERIEILSKLGAYLSGNDSEWAEVKEKAFRENQWFIPGFIDAAVNNIVAQFLNKDLLATWAQQYQIASQIPNPKNIGIVMAGNIPLVGFHDLLSVFMSGHIAVIKPSSKDEVLIKHIVSKLYEWDVSIQNHISFAERLNNCDAYIATGSNNASRYFEAYFGKYPNIIRKNRTSIAVIDGKETKEQLEQLADDAMLFFGLGCRNVTQLLVPTNYDFIPLLDALKKHEGLMEFHKYKHNFDYHLALLIMGGKYYMNNDSVILTPNISPFSPVSQINYFSYENEAHLKELLNNESIQCIVGNGYTPFGKAQQPSLTNYADGIDTMAFLSAI